MLLTSPLKEEAPVERASVPSLVRKLRQFDTGSDVEAGPLERLLRGKVQTVAPGVALIERGEQPSEMHVVLSGWACRHRSQGRKRQILAFHVPGDICDFNVFLMRQMDSTITALSPMRVASIGRAALAEFNQNHPRTVQGFWWETLSSASIQREWLIRNTGRGARERVAGLICELAARLFVVGLASDDGFEMPLTQYDLADACALTSEHTNRTLRELRELGLVMIQRGEVRFGDWDRLSALAGFDPGFLHFRQIHVEQVAPLAFANPAPV